MSGTNQTFNVSFSKKLLKQVDAKAAEQFGSRSDLLRAAALEYIKRDEAWKELFNYGKEVGTQAEPESEEAVARAINQKRRTSGRWFVK
ncbi:ribbon-helix-helix protein, CopG family [Candidatus Saccharibacteria bacterium]|jgi:metal-responsive CopG/Arc/MetJ family transcriptional regulator|nr:ribbon-helix-helix protein, CopG family [Candidatus Saccharibacteria bacterium]